jgi:hypothetical protein
MFPSLLRETSLCSAIEDLSSTSAPFEDPFSADMAAFAEQFLVHGFETPALPSSFAGVATTIPSRSCTHVDAERVIEANSSLRRQVLIKFLRTEHVADAFKSSLSCSISHVFPPM